VRKCLVDWRDPAGEGWLPPGAVEALNSGASPARDRTDPSYDRPLTFDESRRGYRFAI
jgi:hypothetical protein